MKNYILLFLIGITFVNCSNDDDIAASDLPTNARVIGNWNWISSSGGIGGWTYTPDSTGDTQRLEITDSTITFYKNGEETFTDTYTIETRESVIYSGTREMIIADTGFRNIVEFDDNTLILIGDCNDCFASGYVRE
ncbi:hypothetical protein [Kordia sp.]|uniref:hypothetical protein n=1 Tax=Kordia sp. TaxID=1965332 RepID=UPI003D2E0911